MTRKIELLPEDYLKVAMAVSEDNSTFALQVKCMALIRMLEEAEERCRKLEEQLGDLNG